jgi:Glycosyltransferase family 87
MPRPLRTHPNWWLLGFGLVLVLGLMWVQRDRVLTGRNDFIQLWVSANLVGSPQLYDFDVNRQMQIKTIGVTMENVTPSRPPFYAILLKPFGWLPYNAAFPLFQLLSIACLIGFVWLNRARSPELGIFCCFSMPVIANLANGQDLGILIFLVALALIRFEKHDDFIGGLILSLCAIKFHLFLLVPIVPLLHRRWRILAGGATGGALLLLASTIVQGPGWFRAYLDVLRNPILSPGSDIMPNLHGAFATLGPSKPLELAACAVVALMVAYLAWRETDFEIAFAYALLGGLLVSFHAYLQDAMILLPVLVTVLAKVAAMPVRHMMVIAALPPLHLMLLGGSPYSVACPLAMLAILVVALLPQSGIQQTRKFA